MKTLVSHTLVRDGMPYIDLVIRQVVPYVNRCLITISEKSTDGTLQAMRKLEREFPQKIRIDFENVKRPGLLTYERQRLIDKTIEDWVLFLDADDLWPNSSLEEIVKLIEFDGFDAYSFNPYQVIDQEFYDADWKRKSFTKLFISNGINYRKEWPRDLIYRYNESLYWKDNPKVKPVDIKYFHLSNLMKWRFRNEEWAKIFASSIGTPERYPEEVRKELNLLLDKIR